jgi:hypothetical protein
MNRPTSSDSATRAFARVGWTTLLVRLHRYAVARLALAPMDAERAGVVESVDLVNTLIVRGLEGTLPWNLPEHATDDEIVGYTCTKLYGMRANLRREAARTSGDDALDERAAEGPDALSLLVEYGEIAAVMRAFEDDAEASRHIEMMLEGRKRADIVKELGCTAEHADVVRKRIIRGIAALCAKRDDNSEDEPPSSGPRGRHHDLQATEERQGAPPEPRRGAGRADRRR